MFEGGNGCGLAACGGGGGGGVGGGCNGGCWRKKRAALKIIMNKYRLY